jgi:SAM-dependent methyltransferase
MNRSITNTIRFFMDECIPPIIRDSKWFMYPFYFLAYRGRNIRQAMNFKKEVYSYTPEKYERFYNNLNSISRNRVTDINTPSLEFFIQSIPKEALNAVDIGCGNGFLLKQVKKSHPQISLTGVDIKDSDSNTEYKYVKANIENLPFADKSFDVTFCCHTLEHIINPEKAVAELKRVTKKLLIVAVPCQRYFFYTLDEHVNFFPLEESLVSLIGLENFTCKKIHGDWAYLGYIQE